MKINGLEDLFVLELQDAYSAETQLVRMMSKMEKAAGNDQLRKFFRKHLQETKDQVQRLEQLLAKMDAEPGGVKCEGMAGLIKEGSKLMKMDMSPQALDAALIGAAQRMEHYEMAVYGTARAYAQRMGNFAAAELLQESLDEVHQADRDLNQLAETWVNFEALKEVHTADAKR